MAVNALGTTSRGLSTEKGRNPPRVFLLALVATLSVLFSLVKIQDPDSWWHLASGRLIWDSGIPNVNSFSSLFHGYPWKAIEWLFQGMVYAVYQAGGYAGMTVLQVLLVTLAFVLSAGTYLHGAGRGKMRPALLLAFLPILTLALSASRFRFQLRPHLISWIGIVLILYLWEVKPRRLPLWFALAGMVWANFHPGVVYGTVLGVLFLLSAFFSRNRDEVRTALFSLALFFAGSLANPFFLYPYEHDLMHFSLGKILPDILEMEPPTMTAHRGFFLFAVLALAAVPLRLRRKDFLYPLLFAVFLPLALFAQRELPGFILAVFPGLLISVQEVAGRAGEGSRSRKMFLAGVAILSALTLSLAWRDWNRYGVFTSFGLGENEVVLPDGAARFIREKNLAGRMYNDVESGGFLIWKFYPERKVFQDGRILAYPPDFLQEVNTGLMHPERMAGITRKYGLDYAVVSLVTAGGVNFSRLFEDLGWKLVYLDGFHCIMVRPGSEDEAKTRDSEFRLIRFGSEPLALYDSGRMFPDRMRREVGRIDPAWLFSPWDSLRFGMAAWGAGDLTAAGGFFRRGQQLEPRDPVWDLRLGDLLTAAGRFPEAEEKYREAVRKGKGTRAGEEAGRKLAREGF